jgi:hypothetical protein
LQFLQWVTVALFSHLDLYLPGLQAPMAWFGPDDTECVDWRLSCLLRAAGASSGGVGMAHIPAGRPRRSARVDGMVYRVCFTQCHRCTHAWFGRGVVRLCGIVVDHERKNHPTRTARHRLTCGGSCHNFCPTLTRHRAPEKRDERCYVGCVATARCKTSRPLRIHACAG